MEKDVLLYSLIAGLATSLGSGTVLLCGRPRPKILAFLLGSAAGIMLAVVAGDLIPSAFACGSGVDAGIGIVLGLLLLYGLDVSFSRRFNFSSRRGRTKYLKMGYMIAVGIALHDLPEGVAIAAGYSAAQRIGLVIVLAIGLHNIPEGMATAAPLVLAGLPARLIILINIGVSLFTPLGTLLGFGLMRVSGELISILLALAAGAMTYICIGELIPEMRRLHPNSGSVGLVFGILLMQTVSRLH